MTEWDWVLTTLVGAYAVASTLLTRAFLKSAVRDKGHNSTGDQGSSVSVIVSVKNGRAHWPAWWTAMKTQNWPDGAEVIVVDDGSSDGLSEALQAAERESVPFTFRHFRMEETRPGKRDALSRGIAQANGDWLLFTDIDCLPAGQAWARTLCSAGQNADAVLGVSWPVLDSGHHSKLLSALQAFDAMHIARSYVGWAERGKPYMGVGRNMAIRRAVFTGFDESKGLASGDDDMLIQALGEDPTCRFAAVSSRPSQMDTYGPTSWAEWMAQKRRHWTTAPHYKRADQWRLLLPKLTAAGMLVAAAWNVFVHNSVWITGGLLGYAWLSDLLNFRSITKACQTPASWRNGGGFSPLWSVWNGLIALSLMVRRQDKSQW